MSSVTQKSGIATGLNHGHIVQKIKKQTKPSELKGKPNKRVKFIRDIVREVTGFAPYERRIVELLKLSDKRARKFAKRRLGTMRRAKAKLNEIQSILQAQRRAAHGHGHH